MIKRLAFVLALLACVSQAFGATISQWPGAIVQPTYGPPAPNVASSKAFVPGNSVGASNITFSLLGYSEAPFTAVQACFINTLSTAYLIDGLMFAPTAIANDNINPLNGSGGAQSWTNYTGPLPISVPPNQTSGANGIWGVACSQWQPLASIPRTDNASWPPMIMARAHDQSGYIPSAGSPTAIAMQQYSGTTAVTSGTYNSGTGAVSLTMAANMYLGPVGTPIGTLNLTGTGSVASLNTTGAVLTAANANSATVQFTGPTGLTLTITGGTLSNANINVGERVIQGYYKSQSLATFQTPSNFTSPTNSYIFMFLRFQTATPVLTVMGFGDSTTQGLNSTGGYMNWGQLAANALSTLTTPVQYFNCAAAGQTTATFYGFAPQCIAAIHPNIVLQQVFSINDPTQNSTQTSFDYQRAMTFAQKLKNSGIQPILLTGLCSSQTGGSDLARVNLDAKIVANGVFPVIDLNAAYCNTNTPQTIQPYCNSGDSTHPDDYCEGNILEPVAQSVLSRFLPQYTP